MQRCCMMNFAPTRTGVIAVCGSRVRVNQAAITALRHAGNLLGWRVSQCSN